MDCTESMCGITPERHRCIILNKPGVPAVFSVYLFIPSLKSRYFGNTSGVNASCYERKEFSSRISHAGSTYFHNNSGSLSAHFVLDQSRKAGFKHRNLFLFFSRAPLKLPKKQHPITNNKMPKK